MASKEGKEEAKVGQPLGETSLVIRSPPDKGSHLRGRLLRVIGKTLSNRITSIKFRSKLYNYFYQGTISTDYIIASFIGSVTLWFAKR